MEVRLPDEKVLYVEVKGTHASSPRLFMTEGERIFASVNSARYTLIVVFAVDLLKQTHSTVEQPRDPTDHFVLVRSQWIGLLKQEPHTSPA